MGNIKYFGSSITGIFAITGNLLGGYFTLVNIFYAYIFLVAIDIFFPKDKKPNTSQDAFIPDTVLFLNVLLHTASVFTLLIGIYSGILEGAFIWTAAMATGVNSGIAGITTAHELIHRKKYFYRLAGIWNLVLVLYGHFYIEHIRGHHKNVGTDEDAATARKGESIYRFFVRTVPQQYKSAYQIEGRRLTKEGKAAFSISNFVIWITTIEIILVASIVLITGINGLFAFLIQAFNAIFLLELVNYIEHYGLTRNDGEKFSAAHSWQSDIISSRITLIELSRHSDHHLRASKPYYQLESKDSPELPSGYFGVFYMVLIPPLWFKAIHSRMKEFNNRESLSA